MLSLRLISLYHKGPDYINMSLKTSITEKLRSKNISEEQIEKKLNELKKNEPLLHEKGRYITPYMSTYRIFGRPLTVSTVHVERLDIHLENEQSTTITLSEDGQPQHMPYEKITKLTSFFELCSTGNPAINRELTECAITIAKKIRYKDVPQHFTWHSSKTWAIRQRRSATPTIGTAHYNTII